MCDNIIDFQPRKVPGTLELSDLNALLVQRIEKLETALREAWPLLRDFRQSLGTGDEPSLSANTVRDLLDPAYHKIRRIALEPETYGAADELISQLKDHPMTLLWRKFDCDKAERHRLFTAWLSVLAANRTLQSLLMDENSSLDIDEEVLVYQWRCFLGLLGSSMDASLRIEFQSGGNE